MVRNPGLFKSTFKLKRFFLVHHKRTLHYYLLSMHGPDEMKSPEARSKAPHRLQPHSFSHLSSRPPLSAPLSIILCFSVFLFWDFCFCAVLLGILSSISLSHKWRKCFIWYEATCQHLFSGLICSLFPFLFPSPAGSFSVNSDNSMSVRSVPAILCLECQNPVSDECPWGSAHHVWSASVWMCNFLVNRTCGLASLKYEIWLCLCGWII